MANKALPVQMLGHSCRCLTKSNIISITHYLPVQAHRLEHLFLCWGKHKGPLSRAVIYECCIRGTWSYMYLAGVAVDMYFLLGLALCYVDWGFFSHLLAELEQVKCGGLAVPQRRGKAWEVHLLVVLCWVEICQVFLNVSCGGPGLATDIQLFFGVWREAPAMITAWLLNQKVTL